MSDRDDSEIEGFLRGHNPFENPPICPCGTCVGHWKILAFLGRGGSSEVYRAENTVTGQVAALKVLARTDGKTRERFKREVRLVAETQNAAFPKFYGAGEENDRLYIAEELLEPVVLPSRDAEVARFILDVAAGVAELHRLGFIHRDIKPRNVMSRSSTGEYVLIDFGLAKEGADTPQARDDTLSVVDGRAVGVGTPGYSAPEQFAGGLIGPATDIHALGMLANACFGGKPPKVWTKIIRRSTSSIPEQRYPSVAEFARAIRRRHSAWWWIVGTIATVTMALAVITLWPYGDRPYEIRVRDGDNPHKADGKAGEMARSQPEIMKDLFGLGKTVNESDIAVTRIELVGRDILIPNEIRLDGKRRIEIVGPGRLTASVIGVRGVSLELSEQAALVNLTTTPYPESSMKYVLRGACYLNFKNLDPPADRDYKNIWVDDLNGHGTPSIRFRGEH